MNAIEKFILDSGSDSLWAFGGEYEGGVHCQQIADELAECLYVILKEGHAIKNYLEIGVASGGTTYVLNHYLKPDNIILVDDNQHPKARLRQSVLYGVPRREIIGKSESAFVLGEIFDLGLKYDLIIIDGGHHYNNVKADADNYLPYLNEGGFIMFHDSAVPFLGVKTVVEELKTKSNLKFIGEYTSKKHKPMGIALFRKESK